MSRGLEVDTIRVETILSLSWTTWQFNFVSIESFLISLGMHLLLNDGQLISRTAVSAKRLNDNKFTLAADDNKKVLSNVRFELTTVRLLETLHHVYET